MNKINNLAKIARQYGITESGNLRDDIVSEYTDIIESLNIIDESIIAKDISLLPVYKINESSAAKDNIPKKCTKCGSTNIGVFLKGEPIYQCKECGKYLGTVPRHESVDILEEAIEPINEILAVDYETTMSYSIGFIKRKMYPISWLKRKRESLKKKLNKYETDLKNFKKMNDEEQSKFCTKINAANGAYSAGVAIGTTVASQNASGGNYSVTYIQIPDKITPYNYPGVINRMIKKLKYDINKLDDLIKQKEKAKNIKEGYAIDLDSLKYVVESKQISLEEAIQEIRDVNYIGDTYPIYCVLPENINENMSIESFIVLNDSLEEAGIIPIAITELSRKDWKDVGREYKYKDRYRFKQTFENMTDIIKNLFTNPKKNGNFEAIRPRLLRMVDRCKTLEDVNYLKRDLRAGKVQLTKLKANKPEIADSIDKHIKWCETVYMDALNAKAKELKGKK